MMNCFIKPSLLTRINISIVLCMLICLTITCQTIYGQREIISRQTSTSSTSNDKLPLTLKTILKLMTLEKVTKNGVEIVLTPEDRIEAALEGVRRRGVAFLYTPEVEERLKEAGANAAVLEAIRRSAAKLQNDEIKVHNIGVQYKELGDKARDAKNYNDAFENYNQAIELNPNDGVAYNQRGKLYQILSKKFLDEKNYDEAKKHVDKAIEDYTEYIRIDPTSTTAFYNRGLCYYMKFTPNSSREETIANGEKAVADFTRVITLSENSQAAYEWRAKTYRYLLGKLDKAAADEQKLQEIKNGKSQGNQP
jgi:tetratricopeptide (TPR) repeat protein